MKNSKFPFLKRLDELRRRIHAPAFSGAYSELRSSFKLIESKLRTQGIEISIEDVRTIGPYLTYQEEHLVLLHIKNSSSSVQELRNNSAASFDTPKFHVTWCSKVDEMFRNNRLDKYVVSQSDLGLFIVASEEDIGGNRQTLEDVRLYACQFCLDNISYRGFTHKDKRTREKVPYRHRVQQVEDFVVNEFIGENHGTMTVWKHHQAMKSNDGRRASHTIEFVEISRLKRERCGWVCSRCNVSMKDRKEGLHCHHVNGVTSDNRWNNLEVLCALCHKNVDKYHAHMEIRPDIEDYIRKHRPSDPAY